jgi:hypothetical protein
MKLYRVKLTSEERAQLGELLSKGKAAARTLTHARILLKADEGVAGPRLSDEAIADALDVNRSTVERVRIRCVEEGFEAALRPRLSRQLHPRKLDGIQEAHLVTLACRPAPNGRGRWSLRLLADKARTRLRSSAPRLRRYRLSRQPRQRPRRRRNGAWCRRAGSAPGTSALQGNWLS